MEKIKLAIVGDSLYAGRLSECIRKNAPGYLEVYGCRYIPELPDYLKRIQPDILLYEQKAEAEENLPETILKIQLTDNRNDTKKALDVNVSDKLCHRPVIFRYQKGSEILRQIFQIYERSSKKSLSGWCKTVNFQITSFYAPGGHELQMPFSLAYAAVCGESDKVLYLNLAEFSGMGLLLGDKDGNTFSDLIYGIRQKKEQFPLCLQSVLHHTEKYDYVLPPENPEDLFEIQEEDLTCLLALLQEKTEYKKVIWNCGTLNHAVEQILECSTKVFCVVKDKSFGKYRKAEFDRFLQKDIHRKLRECVQFISPQAGSGTFIQGIDMMTQIQSGEFAEQARKLI